MAGICRDSQNTRSKLVHGCSLELYYFAEIVFWTFWNIQVSWKISQCIICVYISTLGGKCKSTRNQNKGITKLFKELTSTNMPTQFAEHWRFQQIGNWVFICFKCESQLHVKFSEEPKSTVNNCSSFSLWHSLHSTNIIVSFFLNSINLMSMKSSRYVPRIKHKGSNHLILQHPNNVSLLFLQEFCWTWTLMEFWWELKY